MTKPKLSDPQMRLLRVLKTKGSYMVRDRRTLKGWLFDWHNPLSWRPVHYATIDAALRRSWLRQDRRHKRASVLRITPAGLAALAEWEQQKGGGS